MKPYNLRFLSGAAFAFFLAIGIVVGSQESPGEPSPKEILQSKTVTEAELDISNRPFVFDGTERGNMGLYFEGRTAGTRSFVVGQFQLAPGSEPHPIHTHTDDEVLIVASGEGEIRCDGKMTRVAAGSVMYSAPDVPHGIVNTGTTPLVFYFIKWVEVPIDTGKPTS